MQSARRVRRDFELEADDLTYVARICRMVQGTPLGILLAASWLEALTPREIVEEISRSLDFLETEMHDLPERQRSLRAVFEYSWNLLTEQERMLFAQFSMFRGGFTRDAALQITGTNLRALTVLVNKSLLRRDNVSGRYEVHELLRQYAEEKLEQSADRDSASAAYSRYYLELLAQLTPKLKGFGQLEALNLIDADFENIRAAWNWAVSSVARTRDRRGSRRAVSVPDVPQPLDGRRADVWRGAAGLAVDPATIPRCWREAAGQVSAGQAAGVVPQRAGNRPAARRRLRNRLLPAVGRALALAHRIQSGGRDSAAGSQPARLSGAGRQILRRAGAGRPRLESHAHDGARHPGVVVQQSLDLRREIGDKIGIANSLRNMGGSRGGYFDDTDLAFTYWEEAKEIAYEMNDRFRIAWNASLQAANLIFRGEFDRAEVLIAEGFPHAADLNHPVVKGLSFWNEPPSRGCATKIMR